jgi:hypothetical protein
LNLVAKNLKSAVKTYPIKFAPYLVTLKIKKAPKESLLILPEIMKFEAVASQG